MELSLSIIVPVYNVEKYLNKCVSTLLNQDLEKSQYEIILIDDGSTDDSCKLCDNYANSESNVAVIHQVNQGLSVARNTGFAAAKGRYILFVDSDDWLEENTLKRMVQRMEDRDLDVLSFSFRRVVECDGIVDVDSQVRRAETSLIWAGPEYLIHKLGFLCYAWQFIVKRSFLVDNQLLFTPGIIYEDADWTPRLLENAKRVSESGVLVYNYRQREGSITKGSMQKVVDGQLALIDLLKNQMNRWENKCWHKGMIAHTALSIVTIAGTGFYSQRKTILKEIENKHIYPLSTYHANKKALCKIGIINFSPRIACFLIHLVNL